MPTKLNKPLKREVDVAGETYTVTLDENGVTVVRKRFRNGATVTWREIVSRLPGGSGGDGGAGSTGGSPGTPSGGGAGGPMSGGSGVAGA